MLEQFLRGVRYRKRSSSVKPGLKYRILNLCFSAYVLKKEEGGKTHAFLHKYRPQFYFRTTDVTGEVSSAEQKWLCLAMMQNLQ
ncbi:MAG: hypothetical protein CM15mP31_4870 [Gammaproteobacteria bacterium]|nr:MAG: hypothetical protein CM15mP31_4870 [Gammaproteobacteria bacterium]